MHQIYHISYNFIIKHNIYNEALYNFANYNFVLQLNWFKIVQQKKKNNLTMR